jgi:hypothetical protein
LQVAHTIFGKVHSSVVSLNCRDETHPNVGTRTQWHTLEPGMLRKRDTAAMHWSSNHARCC